MNMKQPASNAGDHNNQDEILQTAWDEVDQFLEQSGPWDDYDGPWGVHTSILKIAKALPKRKDGKPDITPNRYVGYKAKAP